MGMLFMSIRIRRQALFTVNLLRCSAESLMAANMLQVIHHSKVFFDSILVLLMEDQTHCIVLCAHQIGMHYQLFISMHPFCGNKQYVYLFIYIYIW